MAGEVVHVEFPSSDIERAQRFWSGLFGWEFGESMMPGMEYRMARTGDETGAAILETNDRPGHPKFYFATDDIEASLATVGELGGAADAKVPVPMMGWFAACTDSEGNMFHLWQADQNAG